MKMMTRPKNISFLVALVWCMTPTLLLNVLLNSSLVTDQMTGNIGQTLEAFTAPFAEGLTPEEKRWLETAREESVALEGVGLENAEEEREWLEIFRVSGIRQKSRFRAFVRKQKGRIDQQRQATQSVVVEETAPGPARAAKEKVVAHKEKQEEQVDRQQATDSSTPEETAPRSATGPDETVTAHNKEQTVQNDQQEATPSVTAEETAPQSAPAAKATVTAQNKEQKGQFDQQQQATTVSIPPAKDVVVLRKKPDELKLPTPIIVMGLMKAGTTSIYSYFKCGMDLNVTKLSHYDCRPAKKPTRDPLHINLACGRKIGGNVEGKKSAFDGIRPFHLFAEIDGNSGKDGLFLPQYKHVPELYAAFPNATWILNLRDPHKWLNSIDRWQDLRHRFISSHFPPDLPRKATNKPDWTSGEKDEEMLNFYNVQAQRVRDFARNHTSLHFVEVHIDKPDAGQILEDAFGISQQCWGNKNANTGKATWTEH